MKTFNKYSFAVLMLLIVLFVGANVYFGIFQETGDGRPYQVEINRLVHAIEDGGPESVDVSTCQYVTNVESYGDNRESFIHVESDYAIRKIGETIYRFDYSYRGETGKTQYLLTLDVIFFILFISVLAFLWFIRKNILQPFEMLTDVPYELAKGNLTAPLKENKSRFFGKFVWGVNLLRENMEQAKQRELNLQKSKKTLLLSLSHDIKTPLSAIKLYAKALSKGIYKEKERQLEIAEKINGKADEIEDFLAQIIAASKEDFLSLEVDMGEFYLSQLLNRITGYYREKLSLVQTAFLADKYEDCLLKGDLDRSVEVIQNLMENAIKYGDGKYIRIHTSQEDGCRLVTVQNSGCSLTETELPHIFDSFWRGSNTGNQKGNGLGLYICRQLMHKMNGEIFAQVKEGDMTVTVVFNKA